MQPFQARLSSFISSKKPRGGASQQYLEKRLRGYLNNGLLGFEEAFSEKPNTIFTSRFILNCIAVNKNQIVVLDENGEKHYYLYGMRVVLTKTNILFAAVCSSPEVIEQDLQEVNNCHFDLVQELDQEFWSELLLAKPATDTVQ